MVRLNVTYNGMTSPARACLQDPIHPLLTKEQRENKCYTFIKWKSMERKHVQVRHTKGLFWYLLVPLKTNRWHFSDGKRKKKQIWHLCRRNRLRLLIAVILRTEVKKSFLSMNVSAKRWFNLILLIVEEHMTQLCFSCLLYCFCSDVSYLDPVARLVLKLGP